MRSRTLLLGPPGCGKTTSLLGALEQRIQGGIPPERIAYVSFTRAAVRDAKDRAVKQFNFDPSRFPYWRTLHSLCFQQLGLNRRDVFARNDYKTLAEITGEDLKGHSQHDTPTLANSGDGFLFMDQYSRNTQQTLRQVWEAHSGFMNWYRLLRFVRAYERLRGDHYVRDFTDMLESYVASPEHDGGIDVDVAFIDEAQDLSPLQWAVARKAFGNVREVVLAGDDDQSIFAWAGADPTALLRFNGEKQVLNQSYRLPQRIYKLAIQVVSQIKRRNPKIWHPAERQGTVSWLNRADEINLRDGKEWLLLARTRHHLSKLIHLARTQGVYYSLMGTPSVDPEIITSILLHEQDRKKGSELPVWYNYMTNIPVSEREYILSCLRNGEKLTIKPRIQIETIHGAKGNEAPNVALLTDYSEKVKRGMQVNFDAELRVLYVALTRASENLMIINPERHHYGYVI